MIYFLINNNYHYFDFKNHLLSINKKNEVALIEIPHTLGSHKGLGVETRRYVRSNKVGIIAKMLDFISLARRVRQDIIPKRGDVLFFYTEHELLNQYIVSHFKKAGSRVYLIEDGGFGTYVPFRMLDSEPLNFKEKIKEFSYRLFPGLPRVRLQKLNGLIFPWMPDECIDGVCTYKPVVIGRNIPVHFIKRPPQLPVITTLSKVVFLNEPIYGVYQNTQQYLEGLLEIIEALCNGFREVLFKFHPRESQEWRQRIREKALSRFPKMIFIEENTAIEETIESYCPSVVASYFCSALLSLSSRGIEPLYLYHLIPDLERQPIMKELTSILTEFRYNFVTSFSAIDSKFESGFKTMNSDHQAATLNELLGHG